MVLSEINLILASADGKAKRSGHSMYHYSASWIALILEHDSSRKDRTKQFALEANQPLALKS